MKAVYGLWRTRESSYGVARDGEGRVVVVISPRFRVLVVGSRGITLRHLVNGDFEVPPPHFFFFSFVSFSKGLFLVLVLPLRLVRMVEEDLPVVIIAGLVGFEEV